MQTTHILSERSFAAVSQFFERASGIRLPSTKHALVQSRLQKLAQEAGADDIDSFVTRIVTGKATAAEVTQVVDKLTTNETYFFREPEHFNDLSQRLRAHVPTTPGREFLVWSGASSSGEEAFSIAMLMHDVLGKSPWRVMGTDLSSSVVASARQALFPMERGEMIPPVYLKRYCLKGQGPHEGKFLVSRELRERVQFLQGNLMAELPELPLFDVIFLRNVLIYFDNDAKSAIVGRVLQQLKPGGVLYTGHAESLASLNLPIKPLKTAVYVQA